MDPFSVFLIVMAVGVIFSVALIAYRTGKSKSGGSRFTPGVSGTRYSSGNSASMADDLMDEMSGSSHSGRRRSSSAAAGAAVSSPVHSDSGGFSGGGFSGGGDCGGGGGGGGCF